MFQEGSAHISLRATPIGTGVRSQRNRPEPPQADMRIIAACNALLRMHVGHRHSRSAAFAALLALVWTSSTAADPHVDRTGKTRVGEASYETRSDAGKTTASGVLFNPRRLTAASPTLPLGTEAKVTNRENGKSVDVTVTDRGPIVHKRILDVSPAAATKLGLKKEGVASVKVRPLRQPGHTP